MRVRSYTPADREAVLEIHFRTWLLGGSAESIADDRSRFDSMILPYLERFPEFAFVAEEQGVVVGYCVGALCDVETVRAYVFRVFGNVLALPFLSSADRRFWLWQVRLLFGFLFRPHQDVLAVSHPRGAAHLHINMLHASRGKGAGSSLLASQLEKLRTAGAKRVHADSWGTRLKDTSSFWEKNRFSVFSRAPTRFWKAFFPEEQIESVCYARKL